VKIKWWGHATFTITTFQGTKIVTDPYNEDLPYKIVNDKADIVTVSHDHFDHNAVDLVPGSPSIVRDISGYSDKEIKIKGIKSYHDDQSGNERGENIIFIYNFNDIKLSHLGDLGHPLNEEQKEALKDVDVLLIPVGGHFTIDADQAYKIVKQINPKVIFPMHYKTDILDLPIKGVDKFLKHFDHDSIVRVNGPEIEFSSLPFEQKVYVPEYVK